MVEYAESHQHHEFPSPPLPPAARTLSKLVRPVPTARKMTTFQSVNMSLGPRSHTTEDSAPTTPRNFLDTANAPLPPPSQSKDASGPSTPTRHSFTGTSTKRALPTSPFSSEFPSPQQAASQTPREALTRADSQRSTQSTGSLGMDDSDDGEDGSDAESMDDETGRPSKKKKGQRFFCTDFPPCNLSFTRSEHLARHIRFVIMSNLRFTTVC